jgi:hypothetical protein
VVRTQRNPNSPRIISVEPLTREDLQFLQEKSAVRAIDRLTARHWMLVQCFARGMTNNQIAAHMGYTASRVSVLSRDPTIMDEVAKLRKASQQEALGEIDDAQSILHKISMKGLYLSDELLDRVLDGQETITPRDLARLTELGLDRSGHGKRSMNVNVNVDFAARLEKARAIPRNVPVIDAELAPDKVA